MMEPFTQVRRVTQGQWRGILEMNTMVKGFAGADDESVVTGTVEILQPWVLMDTVSANQLSAVDDKSAGFDPYDTASLYVK